MNICNGDNLEDWPTRMTITGAAIIFFMVALIITVAVRFSPPNLTIKNEPVVRHLTER
jgi:hypothetical protein